MAVVLSERMTKSERDVLEWRKGRKNGGVNVIE